MLGQTKTEFLCLHFSYISNWRVPIDLEPLWVEQSSIHIQNNICDWYKLYIRFGVAFGIGPIQVGWDICKISYNKYSFHHPRSSHFLLSSFVITLAEYSWPITLGGHLFIYFTFIEPHLIPNIDFLGGFHNTSPQKWRGPPNSFIYTTQLSMHTFRVHIMMPCTHFPIILSSMIIFAGHNPLANLGTTREDLVTQECAFMEWEQPGTCVTV